MHLYLHKLCSFQLLGHQIQFIKFCFVHVSFLWFPQLLIHKEKTHKTLKSVNSVSTDNKTMVTLLQLLLSSFTAAHQVENTVNLCSY